MGRVTLASESCFIRPTVTGGQTRMASLDYTYEHIIFKIFIQYFK